MSVWLGGLLMMAIVVMRGNEIEERRDVVLDFSFVACGAWSRLGQRRSRLGAKCARWRLRDTDYGHILVIKLVVFSLMAVFVVQP
jgi:putative copper export protein